MSLTEVNRSNKIHKPCHRTLVARDMKLDLFWYAFSGLQIDHGSVNRCLLISRRGFLSWTPWTKERLLFPMNYLEVLALEPAEVRWAPFWRNKKVNVHCDNVMAC